MTSELKAHLLGKGSAQPGVVVLVAIHGMGGIGKSTLAAAVAHDAEARARFPDAVLWATLGQQPDILPLLSGWIQAMGDYQFMSHVETASAYLRSLLREKAALIVVDDVWKTAHVVPFLGGGPSSRVLITTRDATIAEAMGAWLLNLDVMTSEQALGLLTGRLGYELEGEDRDRATAICKLVDHLPLALELVAALIVDGIPWSELLEDLKADVARLGSLEIPGLEYVTALSQKTQNLR